MASAKWALVIASLLDLTAFSLAFLAEFNRSTVSFFFFFSQFLLFGLCILFKHSWNFLEQIKQNESRTQEIYRDCFHFPGCWSQILAMFPVYNSHLKQNISLRCRFLNCYGVYPPPKNKAMGWETAKFFILMSFNGANHSVFRR